MPSPLSKLLRRPSAAITALATPSHRCPHRHRNVLATPAHGRCNRISRTYQTSRFFINSFASDACYSSCACRKIKNDILRCKYHTHGFSTVSETSYEMREDALLFFVHSTLDDLKGPSHCWLNRGDVTKDLSSRDRVFLVVAGAFVEDFLESGRDSSFMFEKVKSLQQRHPLLNVMGFQSSRTINSDVVPSHLLKTIMSRYITFPILMSDKTFAEMSDNVGYIVFKGLKGPLHLYDKDVDFETLNTAIKELNVQQTEKPGLLHSLRGTWVKPLDVFKEPYLCSPLQNLLLYFPGGIEVDEVNERFFLSDTNHHRIIVFDGNGKIIDCIGSSPGFEEGEFESTKITRPAASYYHDADNCLYFVDSENHAIRRADMESRVVETFYPKPNVQRTKSGPLSWIMDKLWNKKPVSSDSEGFDSKSFSYPWHLIKSSENDLFIFNRSFETLWIMDLSSGLINEVIEGSSEIFETYGHMIMEKSSPLKQIPSSSMPRHMVTDLSVEEISSAGSISLVATFQDNIVFCDTVGQVVLKYNKTSKSITSFQLSKFGTLGLPYWLQSPLESAYAVGFGVPGVHVDHVQRFSLLPGRIDILINVDIPKDTELVEPLDEGCIWRQTRGTAVEVLEAESKAESSDKVGVAQQWYDELDELASLTQAEVNAKEVNAPDGDVQEGKVRIECCVNTSPGTSEVIINAALYLRLKRPQSQTDDTKNQRVARLAETLNRGGGGNRHAQADACVRFLSTSNKDPDEFVFLRPVHVKLKIDSRDHPKAENSKDVILTETFVEVDVSLE